jgi:leader peptidase (prepilin peptidase)/N-methyltransferase
VCDDAAGGEQGRRRGGAAGSVEAAWGAVGAPGRAAAGGATAVALALTVWWWPLTTAAPATGVTLLVLVAAALVDAVEHRLPNPLVALAAVPVVVALTAGLASGAGRDVAWAALAGAAVVGAPLLLTHLVAPAGMGFGDVKAGAVLGAAVALTAIELVPLALLVGLAAAACWGLLRRARSVPLGPALVGGALVALALGRLVGVEAR